MFAILTLMSLCGHNEVIGLIEAVQCRLILQTLARLAPPAESPHFQNALVTALWAVEHTFGTLNVDCICHLLTDTLLVTLGGGERTPDGERMPLKHERDTQLRAPKVCSRCSKKNSLCIISCIRNARGCLGWKKYRVHGCVHISLLTLSHRDTDVPQAGIGVRALVDSESSCCLKSRLI